MRCLLSELDLARYSEVVASVIDRGAQKVRDRPNSVRDPEKRDNPNPSSATPQESMCVWRTLQKDSLEMEVQHAPSIALPVGTSALAQAPRPSEIRLSIHSILSPGDQEMRADKLEAASTARSDAEPDQIFDQTKQEGIPTASVRGGVFSAS